MWWEFDLTWQLIKGLEFVGLATDIKRPVPVKTVQKSEIDDALFPLDKLDDMLVVDLAL